MSLYIYLIKKKHDMKTKQTDTVGGTTKEFTNEQKELSVINEMRIVDISHVMEAADRLQFIKQTRERVEEREDEMAKPIKEGLESIKRFFKPIKKLADDAEEHIKSQVLAWHQTQWDNGEVSPNTVEGSTGKVTVVARKKLKITDTKKIPKEYMILVPNDAMIEAAIKGGTNVPGAELVENYTISSVKI